MKCINLIVLSARVSVLAAGSVSAQIKNQQPAEFPPNSYKGKQYVDSQGCVFIRAGIDGDVAWIPRVTRARKTICGFAPTITAKATAAAPQPAAQPVEIIALEALSAPVPAGVAAAPQRPVVKPRPKVVRQVAPKPKPRVIASAPVVAPRVGVTGVETACPGASPIAQRYLRKSDGRVVVRCGPQNVAIGSYQGQSIETAAATRHGRRADPKTAITVSPQRRIVPRHVALNRINTTNVRIPKGYKAAWQDDRLNPNRAEQTLAGRSQMLLVWTNTVPRRLIDRATGKDVTSTTPLVYPYIDSVTQRAALGEVTIVRRQGQIVKRIVRKRQPVVSTRSAPKVAVAPARQSAVGRKRFVQIGYFTTRAKADKAAQHLAGMGMSARISNARKGGKSYLAVQAGPFHSAKATERAMSRLRGIGYRGAVARN